MSFIGQCLNFNCAFVLVLMLRQTLTFLRTRGFGEILPLDNHIYLHKLTGWLIVFYGSLHTVMHLINFSFYVIYDPVINANNYSLAEFFFTSRPGLFGLIPGWANPTGFLLIIILLIMFICSLPFVRRGGSFEVFYWTHLLYVPFWILVILHGPVFWKWFIIPGCIFVIERVLRFIWMRSDRGKSYVSSGILLPSKVINLVIKRPFHFCHRPGDYVFINIPAIAKYEWHPFTLSSAPEEDDHITLHIRAVGQWTNRLLEFFEKEQERLHNGDVLPFQDQNGQPMEIYVKNSMEKIDERSNMAQNMIMNNDMKMTMKTPMEKAMSMPNMENKMKRLHDNIRSESETSFDHKKMNEAHLKNLGKAYNSPQNKGIAQSFRYMRNKPTIIAFKTPSLEAFESNKNNETKGDKLLFSIHFKTIK
jgi:NADPH oxidase 5